MPTADKNITYSDKYCDEIYEYRHVTLPMDLAQNTPKDRLMTESEWRKLGIQQSRGWEHYMIHKPERHMIMFRREHHLSNNPMI